MVPTLALTEPKFCMHNLPCTLVQYPITTVNIQKFQTLVVAKMAETNSADPDQTASEEAVW